MTVDSVLVTSVSLSSPETEDKVWERVISACNTLTYNRQVSSVLDSGTCNKGKLFANCTTKTSPSNEHTLTPHIYKVKLGGGGYRGLHFFLFLLQNIDCGYSLEPPH